MATDAEAGLSADFEPRVGDIAARIDRLPLTRVQWELALLTQLCWGLIVSTDGVAATIYPFVWKPQHAFSQTQYSFLYAFEVGVGILVGGWLMGFFSDRFGRKPGMALSCLLSGVFLWPMALTNNWGLLMVLSVLSTLGTGGILSTNAVYISELVSPRQRHRVGQAAQTLAIFLLATTTSFSAYWWVPVHYQWMLYLRSALVILIPIPLVLWRLVESPRWLEGKGRYKEADRVMRDLERRCAHYAGPLPEPVLDEHPVVVTDRVPLKELFLGKYGQRFGLLLIAWVLGYSGTVYGWGGYSSLILVSRHASPHFVFFSAYILSLMTVAIGLLLAWLAVGVRFEQRTLIMVGGILVAVSLAGIYSTNNLTVTIILYGVRAIGGYLWLYNMYLFTANCFPTRIRSAATGWTDGIGHMGSTAGPIFLGSLYVFSGAPFTSAGFFLWVGVAGALIPGLLIGLFGVRQGTATLEQIAT